MPVLVFSSRLKKTFSKKELPQARDIQDPPGFEPGIFTGLVVN